MLLLQSQVLQTVYGLHKMIFKFNPPKHAGYILVVNNNGEDDVDVRAYYFEGIKIPCKMRWLLFARIYI